MYQDSEGYWRYVDNDTLISEDRDRPCGKCGMRSTAKGHDYCIQDLPNVLNACCGHGIIEDAYVQLNDGKRTVLRGQEAIDIMKDKKAKCKKDELDKYYTTPTTVDIIAKQIVESKAIDFTSYDRVIEPSAGNGVFRSMLPNPNTEYYDIEPEADFIKKQDWLLFDGDLSNSLVIGNPPFGKRNKMSKAFIEKAIWLNAKTIAFILPNVYMKHTLQKVFPRSYRLQAVIPLPEYSFIKPNKGRFTIACHFFIWNRTDEGIDLRFNPDEYSTDDFEFVHKKTAIRYKDRCFFIFGASPNTTLKIDEVKSNNRGYYIMVSRNGAVGTKGLMRRFQKIKFNGVSSASGGVFWMTKPEILRDYCNYMKGEENGKHCKS